MRTAILALVLAGCSSHDFSNSPADAPASEPPANGDGAPGLCGVGLESTPADALAGPTTMITVTAKPGELVAPVFTWSVTFNGALVSTASTRSDGSQIAFLAPDAGVYSVRVTVGGPASPCRTGQLPVNVGVSNGIPSAVRLRIVPRAGTAAPFERTFVIRGGAPIDLGTVAADASTPVLVSVQGPDGAVGAYVRFSPNASPKTAVEAFAGAGPAVPLGVQPHSVLVVPSVAGLAPRRIANWLPGVSPVLTVDAGQPITGTVIDADGAAVAGAAVRLSIDGVPSTVATTAVDGSFSLHAPADGSAVTVEVTPARASGLPRLSATSQAFDLSQRLAIRYTVRLGDLAGAHVRRGGAALGHATVKAVGSAPIGSVTAGTTATATAAVRIAATTDDAGALPSLRVPPGRLSAVITEASGDVSVIALDTTASAPSVREVPAVQPVATAVQSAAGDGLPGAVIDVVPLDALALAGAAEQRWIAGAAGAITGSVAPGGRYQLRLHDRAGRGGSLVVGDLAASAIAPAYRLPAPLALRGTLKTAKGEVLAAASVQLVCIDCSGLDLDRPITEAASDSAGGFVLAIPDPGTM